MTERAGDEISEEMFLGEVAQLCVAAPALSPLGASILLALDLGLARDSRTFARVFGVAHAIVLREVTELADERGLLRLVDRNARTQRTVFAFTDISQALMARFADHRRKGPQAPGV